MRVNVYAEEMTDRVELVTKTIDGHEFVGVRFYLALPVTVGGENYAGPFIHQQGDDDSAAVTFWGKKSLEPAIEKALMLLWRYKKRPGDVKAINATVEPGENFIASRFVD